MDPLAHLYTTYYYHKGTRGPGGVPPYRGIFGGAHSAESTHGNSLASFRGTGNDEEKDLFPS
jgi:hypothetical protein